jgi:hypothetical protein
MKRLDARWPILLSAALALLAPLAATADDWSPSQLDSQRWIEKGLTYTACAASIVFATTGATITTAIITCSAAINYWFSE